MKQVIVVRKDLNMRKGKMIAQGCHASSRVCMSLARSFETGFLSKEVKWWFDWMNQGETKIALSADSEDQLIALYDLAKRNNLPCTIIADAGHTEIPAGTKTCIAIGPAPDAEVDAITGHLKLL